MGFKQFITSSKFQCDKRKYRTFFTLRITYLYEFRTVSTHVTVCSIVLVVFFSANEIDQLYLHSYLHLEQIFHLPVGLLEYYLYVIYIPSNKLPLSEYPSI
jgi:hypothetical protein